MTLHVYTGLLQPRQQIRRLVALHPVGDVVRRHCAHIVNLRQLLRRGPAESIHAPEMGRQYLSCLGSHLPDTQGEDQPPQIVFLGSGNGVYCVLSGLFPHAVQSLQLLCSKVIQICRI